MWAFNKNPRLNSPVIAHRHKTITIITGELDCYLCGEKIPEHILLQERILDYNLYLNRISPERKPPGMHEGAYYYVNGEDHYSAFYYSDNKLYKEILLHIKESIPCNKIKQIKDEINEYKEGIIHLAYYQ